MMPAPPLPEPLMADNLVALPRVRHGFFTRQGGLSTGLYQGLNVRSFAVSQDPNVAENRRLIAAWFDQRPEALMTTRQVFGQDIAVVASNQGFDNEVTQADAIVCTVPNVIIVTKTADCVPIILADCAGRVAATVHGSWHCIIGGLIEKTVQKIGERARVLPQDLAAAIGPCLRQESYEVDPDFRDHFIAIDPQSAAFFIPSPRGLPDKYHVDLPSYAAYRLGRAGVTATQDIGYDTYARDDLFYSNRRAFHRHEPVFGNQASAVMLLGD
jgi:hypothetical protein